MTTDRDFQAAVEQLGGFLGDTSLTAIIADLEHAIEGCDRDGLQEILDEHAISQELLRGAMLVRERLGRVSDIIHATAIALVLAGSMRPGEVLSRPSLAAGNDPSRHFDIESDQRVAEFKLARWDGSDAMRKRHVFKDLVMLAADSSGRDAELYVLGDRPVQFLHKTRSTARWALDRFPATRELFEDRFGSLDMSIAQFTTGPAHKVKIINLEEWAPDLFSTTSIL
jgi:hypothetical protein